MALAIWGRRAGKNGLPNARQGVPVRFPMRIAGLGKKVHARSVPAWGAFQYDGPARTRASALLHRQFL